MFHSCMRLTSLDLSGWDTSNVTTMSGMFYACSGLTSLKWTNWKININLTYSPLSVECLKNLLNNLATVSNKTLNLGSTNLSKLTDSDKAIAASKGWSLA